MTRQAGPSTRSVHLKRYVDPLTHSLIPPLIQNAAYAYEDLDTWKAVALKEKPGDIYSRNSNPTTRLFEEKVAALEGAQAATSFATGMAAITSTLFALLSPGKRAISVKDSYGGTYLFFTRFLPRFGVECVVCETEDHEEIEAEIKMGCDVLYLESPTNPTLKVVDLERLFKAGHQAGAVTICDNTFATPINQNPIDLGADLVIHSATKFLGGHGDVLGGVLCGNKELVQSVYEYREITGPALDSYSAFLLLRSLKTLGLRVERQNENALGMARFLEEQPQVNAVYYPGLESNIGHEIAKKQMRAYGGVLSFDLKGGYEAVKVVINNLKYAYMAANLGQVETVVGPPGTTSHVELTEGERAEAGIPEGLIRYAVGIEDIEDLKEDMANALSLL
ncbi:MAG: aminotransferase class I/II-fold pyridoxal phosphate-dependent enzyme [Anaerolineaceae bacterium]|nr:aminotransferase class I/II-fold pyridoxal phosphate-dependent enzyme [Anaerolineaceae bacterium]